MARRAAAVVLADALDEVFTVFFAVLFLSFAFGRVLPATVIARPPRGQTRLRMTVPQERHEKICSREGAIGTVISCVMLIYHIRGKKQSRAVRHSAITTRNEH